MLQKDKTDFSSRLDRIRARRQLQVTGTETKRAVTLHKIYTTPIVTDLVAANLELDVQPIILDVHPPIIQSFSSPSTPKTIQPIIPDPCLIIPIIIPPITPNAIPPTIPNTNPPITPNTIPPTIPDTIPDTSPPNTPITIPPIIPDITPTILNTIPSTIPPIIPPTIPDTIPPTIPDTSLPITPITIPPIIPDITPTILNTITPIILNTIPDTIPPIIPDTFPPIIPDITPTIPNIIPPIILNTIPPTIPDTIPPTIPDTSPPNTPTTTVPISPTTILPIIPNTIPPTIPNIIQPAIPDTSLPLTPLADKLFAIERGAVSVSSNLEIKANNIKKNTPTATMIHNAAKNSGYEEFTPIKRFNGEFDKSINNTNASTTNNSMFNIITPLTINSFASTQLFNHEKPNQIFKNDENMTPIAYFEQSNSLSFIPESPLSTTVSKVRNESADETISVSMSMTTASGFLDWDTEGVNDWLHYIQLEKLSPMFIKNNITGVKLNAMTITDLLKIGVNNSDDQQIILHEIAELKILWQVESESNSVVIEDLNAGLVNMSVKRRDLENELNTTLSNRLSEIEEIRLEHNNNIDTSINLLKELQNPDYSYNQSPLLLPPVIIDNTTIATTISTTTTTTTTTTITTTTTNNNNNNDDLDDLREQSLISDSSHNTEVEVEQSNGLISKGGSSIRPPTIFLSESQEAFQVKKHQLPKNEIKDNLYVVPITDSDSTKTLEQDPQLTVHNANQDPIQTNSAEYSPIKRFQHSREASRAHSEDLDLTQIRPLIEIRPMSDSEPLIDSIAVNDDRHKNTRKKGFFRKFLTRKNINNEQKITKKHIYTESFTNSVQSDSELMNTNKTVKKLAEFFGVEACSPTIQSILYHNNSNDNYCMMRIYVSKIITEITYKSILVHPKDTCDQILKLVLKKSGLLYEDTNRYCLVEVCVSNINIPDREVGLHENPLLLQVRHSDLFEIFRFEVQTKSSTNIQFNIEVIDLMPPTTYSIQLSPTTTTRETLLLIKTKFSVLDRPTIKLNIKLVIDNDNNDGDNIDSDSNTTNNNNNNNNIIILHDYTNPVMLYYNTVTSSECTFSIIRQPDDVTINRTKQELLSEIHEMQIALEKSRLLEVKFATLEREHLRLVEHQRQSSHSTGDLGNIDQMQEVEIKYRQKVEQCREQAEKIKSLKETNEDLSDKLNYIKSDMLDDNNSLYSHDPLICELKSKLSERQRNLASVDELQTLTEKNDRLNEELRQTQLMVKELQSLYNNNNSDNNTNNNNSNNNNNNNKPEGTNNNGIFLYKLLMNHKSYEFIPVELDLQNSTSGLGVTVNKHRDAACEGTYIQNIYSGSVAEREGSIHIGDRLVELNNLNISYMTPKEIVALFRKLKLKVNLVIARDKENKSFLTKDNENSHLEHERLTETMKELEDLRETLKNKVLEIEYLNTDIDRMQENNKKLENSAPDPEILQLELNSNREYLEYILQQLEQCAPELIQKISNDYNYTTQDDTNYSDSINDEEWC